MSRWQDVVRRELVRYVAQTDSDVVELGELYEQFVPTLRTEFPDNNHPKAKLRQILQQLRDRDELRFIGNGVYGIEALDTDGEADGATIVGGSDSPNYTAETYETTVESRSMPAAFRIGILDRYDHTCPISGVDHDHLLDVAHILPWSEYPDHRTDPENVLLLSKTHHAAFDAGLFTLDASSHLRVDPDFETQSTLLQRTLLEKDGERVALPTDPTGMNEYLREHNSRSLDWWEP